MPSKLKNILTRFESYARKAMDEWHVPGMAAAIVKGDRFVYAKGFGVKKLGGNNPVDEKTVFQVGSVSKSFTATLVSMLVDEGKLNWKDKVKHHLPNFKLHDPIATCEFRVEDLMSQRSGLPPHSGRLLPHLGFNRDYIMNTLRYIKPACGFRSEYAYQNNLFLVAAALVEKTTGKSWEYNLSRRILLPLGMRSTTATLAGYQNSGHAAQGHYYKGPGPGSGVTPIHMNWPYHYWVYTVAPAGGINSTALDLARWLICQLGRGAAKGKRLVSCKNIRFIQTPKIAAGPGPWGETRHYCQGWLHSDYRPYPILWHNGGTSGMKSVIAMVPQAGIAIAVLSNLYESLLPEALSRFFLDLWFGNPHRDWSRELLRKSEESAEYLQQSPAPDMPSRPLSYYTGTYDNPLYGPISVSRDRDSLRLTMGPGKISLKLQHWGGDTFVMYWPGVLTNGAGIQFYTGRSGLVNRVTIEGMNDNLTGFFAKRLFSKPLLTKKSNNSEV